MAETETEAEVVETETTETTQVETTETPEDAAKWKALSRKNESALKKALAENEKLQAASMSEQEKAVAVARAEGRAEATKDSNRMLLRAEVRAAAAGVLADPDDAVHLLDLEPFDTGAEPDRPAIKAALAALVKAKPYLAAGPGNGAGEGGPRGNGAQQTAVVDPLEQTLRAKLGIR